MINKLTSPFLFIVCLFVTACSDNNDNEPIIPFSLEKNYYEVKLKRGADCISITNGSGDISLAIENAKSVKQCIYAGTHLGLKAKLFTVVTCQFHHSS